MVWDAETIRQLRELWAEGLSTAEIGRRLGFSKNAIVGKAHRLDLSARPSPIRREAARPPSPSSLPTAATLPPLRSAGPVAGTLSQVGALSQSPTATVQVLRIVPETAPPRPVVIVPAPAPSLAPLRPMPPPHVRRTRIACCWPMGEPGTRNFRFCDAEAVASKPYCEEHVKVAYIRAKDRKEDAA